MRLAHQDGNSIVDTPNSFAKQTKLGYLTTVTPNQINSSLAFKRIVILGNNRYKLAQLRSIYCAQKIRCEHSSS